MFVGKAHVSEFKEAFERATGGGSVSTDRNSLFDAKPKVCPSFFALRWAIFSQCFLLTVGIYPIHILFAWNEVYKSLLTPLFTPFLPTSCQPSFSMEPSGASHLPQHDVSVVGVL